MPYREATLHPIQKISTRIVLYIGLFNIILILLLLLFSTLYNFKAQFRRFEKRGITLLEERLQEESITLAGEELSRVVKEGIFSYAGLFKSDTVIIEQGSLDKRVVKEHYRLQGSDGWELILAAPVDRLVKESILKSLPLSLSLALLTLLSALYFRFLYQRMVANPLLKVVNYLRVFDLIEQGQRFTLNEEGKRNEPDPVLNMLASSINEIGINMQCTFLFLKETNEKLTAQIEKRRGVEERLKKSEERYKELVENTSDWLWELDADNCFTYVSPRVKELLGYEPEELYGKNAFDLMSRDEARKVEREYSEYLTNHSPFNCMVNVNLHRDGHKVILESSGNPIFDSEGNFKGYRGIDRDITAKKRAEAFLQNIIESMPSALYTITYEGIITRANRKAEEITGLSEKQLVGREITELIPYFNRYKELFSSIKEEKQPTCYRYESFTELKERYFDLSFYPLTSEGIEGIVIRMDDVTEQQKIEKQLIQSHKMESIGVLAGGLAHDFNNILAGIITTVSILKYEMKEKTLIPEELEEYINTIERAGERAASIVKQLLAISRKNKTNYSTVDLNKALENVLKICRNSFDKCVTIEAKAFPGTALIRSEQTQIEQIILNLCINGYHAMTIMREPADTTGGTLSLQIDKFTADAAFCRSLPGAEEREYYRLTIVDSGIGMDSDTMSRIFEPFFTTKEQEKGTGLGLSMTYSLVKEHKGFITVHSEKGKGTTVTLFIPSLEEDFNSPHSTTLPERRTPHNKGPILIIDDEDVVRTLAGKILEKKGYSILKAAGGREGLAIFAEKHRTISLVLLDISMPEISGKEIFIEMQKIDPHVKVIICSGLEQDHRVEALKTMGIKGFLQKPYSMQQLLTKVAEVIEEE